MSGRLPYHVNQVNIGANYPASGIARNMTCTTLLCSAQLSSARCCRVSLLSRAGIPKKLKQAGYQTHAFGKWHLGMASPDHTPLGRGFDNSLIFFAGAQDHWSNCNCVDPTCAAPNNGFISGHNRSAGAHCWRTIADPLTKVPTVAFA